MNLLWCLVSVTAMTRVVYTVCTVGGVCTLDWVIVGEGMEGERERLLHKYRCPLANLKGKKSIKNQRVGKNWRRRLQKNFPLNAI